MRAVRSVLYRTAAIHRVPLAFRTSRLLSFTPSPSTPPPESEGKQDTPTPIGAHRKFSDMTTIEEVLQHVAAPDAALNPLDHARALARVERIFALTGERSFFGDPRFLALLDGLSTAHFPAIAIGMVAHSLKNLKLQHTALEKHLQTRASQAKAWLDADALDSYISWAPMVRDLDLGVLFQILKQVERQRKALTSHVIIRMLRCLGKIPLTRSAPAIDVLVDEFVGKSQDEAYKGFVGGFCHACATLGKFTPALVTKLNLSDYCTGEKDIMVVPELRGLLGAFSDANIPIPDDILQLLAVRTTVLAATMKGIDACQVLYYLGRGAVEGAPLSPYVTPLVVDALLRAVTQNLARLNAREVGRAVYGLVGLPKTQGLEAAVGKLGLQLEKKLKANVEVWTSEDLMRALEGFAGLRDVHQPSKFLAKKIFRNLDKVKHRLDYRQATRAVLALGALQNDSAAIRTFGTYFLTRKKETFPSKEAADAFQGALDGLPTQTVLHRAE